MTRRLKFQPTPPAGAETKPRPVLSWSYPISTHSARGGGDAIASYKSSIQRLISTHSARGGGDPLSAGQSSSLLQFQPTPPAGAETP